MRRRPVRSLALAPERGSGDRRTRRSRTAGRWLPASARQRSTSPTCSTGRLPLIRYEITDEVTILTEPCPCGSAFRCVADIQGRLDDVFVYDGLRIHPHVFRSALGRHAGVVEYQVRQTTDGAQIAVRCRSRVDLEALGSEIDDALAAPWSSGDPSSRSGLSSGWSATRARPNSGASCRWAPGPAIARGTTVSTPRFAGHERV